MRYRAVRVAPPYSVEGDTVEGDTVEGDTAPDEMTAARTLHHLHDRPKLLAQSHSLSLVMG